MITVYPLSILLLGGICSIGGWAIGFSFARNHAPKGTQTLYADHLKVYEIRQRFRNFPPLLADLKENHIFIEDIRGTIGDANYREF